MSEQSVPLTIADLKKGTQLIEPKDGWIIVVEGANANGNCIVTPLDGSGPSTAVQIFELNAEGYKIHAKAETSGSLNFYDIFDGLIIENKEGERLTIRELEQCKVVVESEKGNSTVTSLEDLNRSEYYLLKPEQQPEEYIVALNLTGTDKSVIAIVKHVIVFGYNFLNVQAITWDRKERIGRDSDYKEIGNFNLNFDRIDNFPLIKFLSFCFSVLGGYSIISWPLDASLVV